MVTTKSILKYMKKLTLITMAVFCLIACSEDIENEIPESGRSIIVKTEIGSQARAGYEGTTVLPSEFIMDVNQENRIYNYSLVKMVKQNEANIYTPSNDVDLLWADESHSNVRVKAMTIPYGLNVIDNKNPMTVRVCSDQKTNENIKKSDLLGATSDNGISVEGDEIRISFSHLMSKLYVVYKFEGELSGASASVNSATLENTCISGGYSYISMDFSSDVPLSYDNIDMFHNSTEKTAECVFYPYVPTEDPTLVIKTTINGTEKTFRCPISLENNSGFVSGKRYKMSISITGSDAIDASAVAVKDWVTDENSNQTEYSEKVLWIGTSIPAGDIQHGDNGTTDLGSNNYPKMVADALGFTLYNNARGSSFVCFYPPEEDGTSAWKDASDWSEYSGQVWKGYSLSASHAQIDEKFRPLGVPEWLINSFKRYSYESLIIPYIDGTIANCTTVIIDHGHNDRHAILNESSWHNSSGETQFAIGSGWDWLYNLRDTRNSVSESFFQGEWNNQTGRKNSYFGAMIYLVRKILEINPRINIIFGNYFAWKSPVFGAEYGNDNYCNFLCAANEALASMLKRPLVNVYEYTGIRNININGKSDYSIFCPDGVHPHSDTTGESNRIIADIYVKELRGILGIK